MDDALTTAKSCRHYAMCKIDFLGSGVCPSGPERRYDSFYPQGRMALYAALAEGRTPVTPKVVEIAESCDLCGRCDYQCYFVTEMRPTKVMSALKDLVARHLASRGRVERPAEDALLGEIRSIVGAEWAENDRGIAAAYSGDPGPLTRPRTPAYVVLPGTRSEVSAVVRLFHDNGIPWAVRGNGSQNMGLVLSEGAVIDLCRMKDIVFDEKNWTVRVGAGVSAFDAQSEAFRRGYRVNVAEPAALVCANVVCSGIFSTFMPAYGVAADNFVDAEFVARDGSVFSLSDKNAPNLFAFRHADEECPGICTSLSLKLHPTTPDEGGILVPFDSREKALRFIRDCSVRRIGLALTLLGPEYASAFLAPTKRLAADVKEAFTEKLRIPFLVLVIGDAFALRSVGDMGYPAFDQRMFRAMALGLPSLRSAGWLGMLEQASADKPFSYLKIKGFAEMAELALEPSPEQLCRDLDPDLRPFYEKLFARPEMTDLVWLSMFRILSARMGREKQFSVNIVFCPLEESLIGEIIGEFRSVAERHGLKHDLGFITPIDQGKRCLVEYDYFFDQNDPDEIARTRQAAQDAGAVIEAFSAKHGTIRWIRHVVNHGVCRSENLLYT